MNIPLPLKTQLYNQYRLPVAAYGGGRNVDFYKKKYWKAKNKPRAIEKKMLELLLKDRRKMSALENRQKWRIYLLNSCTKMRMSRQCCSALERKAYYKLYKMETMAGKSSIGRGGVMMLKGRQEMETIGEAYNERVENG